MSTTVVISPAVPAARPGGGLFLSLALAAGTGLWLAMRAVAVGDKACADLLSRTREELSEERWKALELRATDMDRLVRAAREAHFLASPLPAGAVRLTAGREASLWAVRTPEGIGLVGEEPALRRLLVANTASRATEFLRSRGYEIEITCKAGGEMHLVGRSQDAKAVKIDVGATGDATVDPMGFRGPECEAFVRDLGVALEGTIVSACRKPEYYGGGAIAVGQSQRA